MFAYLEAGKRRTLAIAVVTAFLAIPAIAYAATAATTRVDLKGAGYCSHYADGAGTAVGKVQITTSPATSDGFHPVNVDIKIRGRQLSPGSYDVWLVDLYRDDAGTVVGCAASPVSTGLTVKGGAGVDFHGSVDRYTGQHEVQVYVGSISGDGYGTSPVLVDVP